MYKLVRKSRLLSYKPIKRHMMSELWSIEEGRVANITYWLPVALSTDVAGTRGEVPKVHGDKSVPHLHSCQASLLSAYRYQVKSDETLGGLSRRADY